MSKNISELTAKLGLDTKDFDAGAKKAQASVDGLAKSSSASASLMQGVFQGMGQEFFRSLGQLPKLIGDIADKGRNFNELAGSFKALGNSDADLNRLRAATQGLVSDVDLFKSANMAESLGITQQAFGTLAESADALGDAVGIDTKEALESLTTALGTGNARLLKTLGITVDAEAAQKKYAAQLHITVDQLTDAGKKEATRAAIMEAVTTKTAKLGEGSKSLADTFQQLDIEIKNSSDRFAGLLDQSPLLIAWTKSFALGLKDIASGFIGIGPAIDQFYGAQNRAFAASIQGAGNLQKELDKTQAEIDAKELERLRLRTTEHDKLNQTGVISGILGDFTGVADAKARDKALGIDLEKLKNQAGYLQSALDALAPKQTKTTANLIDTSKASKDAADAFQKFTDKIDGDKIKDESNKIKDSFDRIFDSISGSTAGNFQSTLGTSAIQFNGLVETLKKNVYDGYLAGLDKADRARPEATDEATRKAGEAAAEFSDKFADVTGKTAIKFGEDLKDQIQKSADFFSDAFYNVFTGAAFDFEDMLKRIGAGLAGGVLGKIFPEFGDISNLQQLGQKIGGKLLDGVLSSATSSGSSSFLGSLVGSVGSVVPSIFSGAGGMGQYDQSGNFIPHAASASDGLAALGIAGAAAGTAYFVFNTTSDNFSGKNKGIDKGESAGFAAIDSIFPGVGSAMSKVFGGRGKGGREADARDAFISSIGDKGTFQGVRGSLSLSANSYNFDDGRGRTQFSDQAVGLTSGLSAVLGGDSKKLREDLNNIFADAVDGGKSFTEVLINAQALMNSLGVDAGAAKDDITKAFLQGKISIEEYNAEYDSLNQLMSTNIEGTGNVDAAIKVLGDSTTNTGAKIQAIALAFNEMKEKGIDSSKEVVAFITARFGPEIGKVFGTIEAAGINSFDAVKNAGADAQHVLINAVQGINFSDTMINESAKAEAFVVASNQRIADSFDKVRVAAQKAAEGTDLYGPNGKPIKTGNTAKMSANPPNQSHPDNGT